MEANEIEPYVVHRLAVAGWQGRPAFEPDAFAALYRHTGGVPRRLNQLASRLLLYAASSSSRRSTADDVEAVAADMAADRPASASQSGCFRCAGSPAEPARSGADAVARAPDRGDRGAARRAGSGGTPGLDRAARLGREREPAAPQQCRLGRTECSRHACPAKAGIQDLPPVPLRPGLRRGARGGHNAERPFRRRRGLVPGRRVRDRDRAATSGTGSSSASSATREAVLDLFAEAGVKAHLLHPGLGRRAPSRP